MKNIAAKKEKLLAQLAEIEAQEKVVKENFGTAINLINEKVIVRYYVSNEEKHKLISYKYRYNFDIRNNDHIECRIKEIFANFYHSKAFDTDSTLTRKHTMNYYYSLNEVYNQYIPNSDKIIPLDQFERLWDLVGQKLESATNTILSQEFPELEIKNKRPVETDRELLIGVGRKFSL